MNYETVYITHLLNTKRGANEIINVITPKEITKNNNLTTIQNRMNFKIT